MEEDRNLSCAGCAKSASPADGSGCSGCSLDKNAILARQDKAISGTLERIRFKLFIMSGKGGVGKSSVTVNLAVALAQKGYRVGVLDVDMHGPSVPGLLGLAPAGEPGNGMEHDGKGIVPLRRGNLLVLSLNSFLKERDHAVLWRGPKKSSAIRQFLYDVNWGELDFLLIDSPPGTGDEHLTVLKTIPDLACIVVTTPQEVALADVRKSLSFLKTSRARILGLVENMSGLSCPHCGGSIDLFKKGGGVALAEDYGLRCLGEIPLDPAAVVAAELGKALVELPEETAAGKAFARLAENVESACLKGEYAML